MELNLKLILVSMIIRKYRKTKEVKSEAGIKIGKVEKILKGSLDSIPSPSPSVKIQIMGRKFG